VALLDDSSGKDSGVGMAEEGDMRLAASVEVADSHLDEGVDMGRPHVEDPGLQSARVIHTRKRRGFSLTG
jgi:hypothetical protein